MQCLCHVAVMTGDIFSFVDRVQVSTHRRSWHLRRSWSLQAGFKRTASQENTSTCLQCVLTVCFGAMNPRAIRQVLTAAKTQRTFFYVSRATNADCRVSRLMFSLIWWSRHNSSVQQRVKLTLNHLTTAKKHTRRAFQNTTGLFWHQSLLFLCFPEHRSCGLVSLRKSGQIFAAHIRAQHQISRIAPQELVASLAQSISMA